MKKTTVLLTILALVVLLTACSTTGTSNGENNVNNIGNSEASREQMSTKMILAARAASLTNRFRCKPP